MLFRSPHDVLYQIMCGSSGASSGGTPPEDSPIEAAFCLHSDCLQQRSTATRIARPTIIMCGSGSASSGGTLLEAVRIEAKCRLNRGVLWRRSATASTARPAHNLVELDALIKLCRGLVLKVAVECHYTTLKFTRIMRSFLFNQLSRL